MINLKKVFRRKKGQGALEYLFMIAAALIIIFVVVRYISQTGSQATSQSDINILQNKAELVKSRFEVNGWWNEDTTVAVDNAENPSTLTLTPLGNSTKAVTYDIPDDYVSGIADYFEDNNGVAITKVYDDCQAGKLGACQVFGILAGSTS